MNLQNNTDNSEVTIFYLQQPDKKAYNYIVEGIGIFEIISALVGDLTQNARLEIRHSFMLKLR